MAIKVKAKSKAKALLKKLTPAQAKVLYDRCNEGTALFFDDVFDPLPTSLLVDECCGLKVLAMHARYASVELQDFADLLESLDYSESAYAAYWDAPRA